MRLNRLFAFSFYLTLAVAASTLAIAEDFFLPWLPFGVPTIALLLGLAWKKEGEWALTETAANYLGIIIAFGTAAWILFQIPQSDEELVALGVPWPAGLLPHLGPLLLLLLLVKAFRPKRLADFWVMQTIGMMMVTLGCVLAYQASFGLLLIVYLAALLWTLALFHLYRERYRLSRPEGPLFPDAPLPDTEMRPSWRRVPGWLVLLLFLSYPAFLLLPRSNTVQWVPQKLSTGVPVALRGLKSGGDAEIDLRQVGKVELSMEEAFRVRATTPAGEAARIPEEQRWRVDVLSFYQGGRWTKWGEMEDDYAFDEALPLRRVGNRPLVEPPQPIEVVSLRFEFRPTRAHGLVLADPIDIRRVSKEFTIGDDRRHDTLFRAVPGTDSYSNNPFGRSQVFRYGQELDIPRMPGQTPARAATRSYRNYLLKFPIPPEIQQWTRALLPTLVSGKGERFTLNEDDQLPSEQHLAAAEALRSYLALSGNYRYDLQLTRKSYSLDPTADFLLNTKQGHCERYASGLALMLRSVGIPARVIKGYHGAESDAPGNYLVRQNQAHSWVEALVFDGQEWIWLTLDATPAQESEAGEQSEFAALLASWAGGGRLFWHNFVLEYNTDIQWSTAHSLYDSVRGALGHSAPLVAWSLLAALVVGGMTRRWLTHWRPLARSKANAEPAWPAFYARWLKILETRLALTPILGQTPLELSRLAVVALPDATGMHASLPERMAAALYRERFGAEPLTTTEQDQLRQALVDFDACLAQSASSANPLKAQRGEI